MVSLTGQAAGCQRPTTVAASGPLLYNFIHYSLWKDSNENPSGSATMTPDPETYLPLTAAAYHVLLALGDRALHGYAMMQAIEEKTGGRDQLLPGSLYATIGRMVEDGMLEEAAAPTGADGRRRYYRVTRLGRAVARAESMRLSRLLEIARSEAYLPSGSRGKA